MITEDYVSFEIAKLLKEKGFDEATYRAYVETNREHQLSFDVGRNNSQWEKFSKENGVFNYSAPTLQMAMKWLREVHNIGVFPTTFYRHTKTFDGHNYGCTLVNLKTFDIIGNFEDCTFPADSYEETCEMAIKYCLENLI